MTWEYGLISFILGVAVGALGMRFLNPKLREQKILQTQLERNKADLEQYRQELIDYFAHSSELLDNMAQDYRKLYQHIAKNSNQLLPDLPLKNNLSHPPLTEVDSINSAEKIKIPPRDYSDGSSDFTENSK
ncbi:hypothetical protein BJP41_02785 [Candidatus Williamhamiltonella defendens]|uniref:Z-ring associated protein G n=2 Tax=Candidatus Williamhamiltonella defendens TaxID=138072 RepID=C4K769_HAMD5|nr:Z-ring associated protein ZapG [Candidatus Hamiltonella defensa]ACQ68412.1 cytochrome d ubiquinol oxidase subunit III [Candidatus Hamiltonella defensa 5AT (Acyrthosiphon pisum)]ATW29447.1 hypothetical protein BJP41_02785 [Candidatus Hamiltonella defensa]ATW31429.1 hypothetical protein BJP42_02870 [Candidatus Hamiltonella defensa]MBK4360933.1 DUF1043 family protein [Candidatus Hamiltonella defensa]